MITIDQVFALLMAFGLLAFGLFTGAQAFNLFLEQFRAWDGARRSKNWATTGGRIEQSELTWAGIRSPRAQPVISYCYSVDGKSYVGKRVEFSFARIYFREEAEAILARYPAETPVTVYYDPQNPAESTLEQRHSSIFSGLLTALVLLLPTALCLAAGLIGMAQTVGK